MLLKTNSSFEGANLRLYREKFNRVDKCCQVSQRTSIKGLAFLAGLLVLIFC